MIGVLIFGGLDNSYSPLTDAWFLNLSHENSISSCSWKEVSIHHCDYISLARILSTTCMQIKLPGEVKGRCDSSISVISSTSSQSAHVLLYGGQHKWAQETIAETTLMTMCKHFFVFISHQVLCSYLSTVLQSYQEEGH